MEKLKKKELLIMTEEKAITKKVTFNMDENIHKRVKQLALDKGCTATDLFNEWVVEALEKEEKRS